VAVDDHQSASPFLASGYDGSAAANKGSTAAAKLS
jgi:hypothetical protein